MILEGSLCTFGHEKCDWPLYLDFVGTCDDSPTRLFGHMCLQSLQETYSNIAVRVIKIFRVLLMECMQGAERIQVGEEAIPGHRLLKNDRS